MKNPIDVMWEVGYTFQLSTKVNQLPIVSVNTHKIPAVDGHCSAG